MNLQILVFSKLIAILTLTNITPFIYPQTALIIAIIALTKIVPLVFSQAALSNLITLSGTLRAINILSNWGKGNRGSGVGSCYK